MSAILQQSQIDIVTQTLNQGTMLQVTKMNAGKVLSVERPRQGPILHFLPY